MKYLLKNFQEVKEMNRRVICNFFRRKENSQNHMENLQSIQIQSGKMKAFLDVLNSILLSLLLSQCAKIEAKQTE